MPAENDELARAQNSSALEQQLTKAEQQVANAREAHYLARRPPRELAMIARSKTRADHERATQAYSAATLVPREMAIYALGEAEDEVDRLKGLIRSEGAHA